MSESRFWELINYSRESAASDKEFLVALKEYLVACSPEEIVGFEICLGKALIQADHFNLVGAKKILDGSVTDDGYLYFRCWVVSLGREVFHSAIDDPDILVKYVDLKSFNELEELLYVATAAYSTVTNIAEEDETFPRSVRFDSGIDYDFNLEGPKGEDWKKADLPNRFPGLWALRH